MAIIRLSSLLFALSCIALLFTSIQSVKCPNDRFGDRCQHENPCRPNPCLNSGKCEVTGTSNPPFRCTCPAGYTASLCEIALTNACTEQPCQNNGHCILTPFGTDEFKCQCAVGYRGDYCEIDVDECAHGHVCQHGGTCENHDGGYHCLCAGGWEGEHCEINQDDCSITRCWNGGTCTDLVSSWKCECAPGFTGLMCHLQDACVTANPCRNGSRCWTDPTNGSATCGCERGFTGALCEIDINECETDPCERGGTCVNTPGSFVCHCPKGITGDLCTININECESNPCHNAGTCADFIGYFVCGCLEGYTGTYCETKIDSKLHSCPVNACWHGGVCIPTTIGYDCICRSGYTGNRCQTRVTTTCTNDRCENGGICNANRTKCLCPIPYDGDRCQIKLSVPPPSPSIQRHQSSTPSFISTIYSAADEYESELCRRNDCKRRANNGICDAPCNYYACDYDGRDCSAGMRPFENCTSASYCAHVFRDGKCDSICNNEACLFDGFDCRSTIDGCNPLHRTYCQDHYANGNCDSGCNTAGCGWDGGDCNPVDSITPQLLVGEIVVILLDEMKVFIEREKRFLMAISKVLRASVRIKLADDGTKMIEAWSRDKLTGVRVVLTVDVSMCIDNKLQMDDVCFSDVDSVAAYLGASSAKQDLLELGSQMYSATPQKPLESRPPYMAAIITLLVLLAMVLLALMVLARKRKISAPVWFPPSTIGADITKGSSIATGLNSISTYDHYQMTKCDDLYNNNNNKRTRRIGPEGQEIMVADGLNHYLTNGCYPPILNGCNNNNRTTDTIGDDASTPLILAIRYSREDEVQTHLDNGADPNECDDHGNTPLHHAVLVNNVNIIRRLLAIENCEIDPVNVDKQTPLILAAKVSMASIECAQELLRHKADCCGSGGRSAVDDDGKTALHWAALNNNVRLIDELITHGANKDAQDNKDETPLFLAAREGHMEAVELLVAKYGASKEITDQMDRWPRDIATENGHYAVANYLDKVQSPRIPPFTHMTTVTAHRLPNRNGTVAGAAAGGGPAKQKAAARRSRSVRETKKEKTTEKKSPIFNSDSVSPYAQHVVLQQQQQQPLMFSGNGATLVHSPHHLISPQSADSPPYSTTSATPSPNTIALMRNASLQTAASSSCMLSPYSEPHSGGSTSGLSPPQMTTMTTTGIKDYRSPPPYAVGFPDKSTYYHHSPPDHASAMAYYQSQSAVDAGGYGVHAASDTYGHQQQQHYHQLPITYFQPQHQQQSNYCQQHSTTLSQSYPVQPSDYYTNYGVGQASTNGY